MWYRVFAATTQEPSLPGLLEKLQLHGHSMIPHFRGDDLGWTQGELHWANGGSPILLARYLTKEDKLRNDLDAYAAELETMTFSPHASRLMFEVTQTQQLITLRRPIDHPNEAEANAVCLIVSQHFAQEFQGFYQIDRQGWFDASGTLLVEEY